MRAVVQRVSHAKVTVQDKTTGEIGPGLLVLVAAHKDDTEADAKKLADRVAGMRIFNDENGKMNLNFAQANPLPLREAEGEGTGGGGSDFSLPLRGVEGVGGGESPQPGLLVVSNFTLYGDPAQRRPSFTEAAPYDQGEKLYDAFVQALRDLGLPVQTGTYGADMQVCLTNEGPVTLIADS
jgi:D-tyrosyl-tRNA(Tyr) deacylase